MPVRKPSPNSRSFSRVTTSSARTSKRTISFSVSNSDHRQSKKDSKTTKKLQLALSSKNFPPTTVVIQKNNSLLRRRRLPSCSVRTIARISANNNGCSNCTLIRSSSSGSSRIKWFCTPGISPVDRRHSESSVKPKSHFKKTSENCEWAKVSAEPPFSPAYLVCSTVSLVLL